MGDRAQASEQALVEDLLEVPLADVLERETVTVRVWLGSGEGTHCSQTPLSPPCRSRSPNAEAGLLRI